MVRTSYCEKRYRCKGEVMEYTYEQEIHQVGRHNDEIIESMYSHAFNQLLVISRKGNMVSFTVLNKSAKTIKEMLVVGTVMIPPQEDV